MKRAPFIALLIAAPAWAQSADDHMLAGAQHFQAGRYPQALVEFLVAERLGDGAAAWYSASTMVKLKRPEDALVSFARAEASAAGERDALFDYYHALACYDARLYLCADRILATIGAEAGPRIAAQAEKIRADLRSVISSPVTTAVLDWYHARADAARKSRRVALAAAYYEEAAGLAALRPDGYRRAEALASLAACRARASAEASAR
jgi:hypothetical protein